MEEQYNILGLNNDGLCPVSERNFGKFMPYFIFGLYEESSFADHHGNVKIIGSANKKKHEKHLQDSRVSITLVSTGSTAVVAGPTIFVLKGQRRNGLFTDEFLRSKGCALGSTIIIS